MWSRKGANIITSYMQRGQAVKHRPHEQCEDTCPLDLPRLLFCCHTGGCRDNQHLPIWTSWEPLFLHTSLIPGLALENINNSLTALLQGFNLAVSWHQFPHTWISGIQGVTALPLILSRSPSKAHLNPVSLHAAGPSKYGRKPSSLLPKGQSLNAGILPREF